MNEQDILFKIAGDLATNTEATKAIERHLEQLNGKVATQEALGSTLSKALDLHNMAIDQLQKTQERRIEDKRRLQWLTIENIFKAVFALAIAYLLWKAGL